MTRDRFLPWLYNAVIAALVILLLAMAVLVAMLAALLSAPPHVPAGALLMTQSVLAVALSRALGGFLIALGLGVMLYAIGAAFGWLKPLPPPFKRGGA